jgi:CRP-like cAMP-binding protein
MEETLKTPQAAAGLLANASFFGSLSAEDRETVALCVRTAVFSAGQVIFLRHDEARDLFVVRKGRVRLSILSSEGRELSLAHATEGVMYSARLRSSTEVLGQQMRLL